MLARDVRPNGHRERTHAYASLDTLELQDWLQRHAIPARSAVRAVRLDRDRRGDVDAWLFDADGVAFELLVLPLHAQRQAPVSPVDEKPMQRLSAGQLQRLLDDDQADAG